MTRTNRVCKVCGRKYYYCPSCPDELRPSWYGLFHDENCRNIFYILRNAFLRKISKASAKRQLEQCDLSEVASFDPDTQKQIKDILDTKKKPESQQHKAEEAESVNALDET